MTTESITFDVREFCKNVLLDAVGGFNAAVQLVAPKYAVRPFELRLTGVPPTLLLGRYDLPTITRVVGSNPGVYCMLSIGKAMSIGRNNLKVTPAIFSGGVPVSIDFYVVNQSGNIPADGEAMWFTIEESLFSSFNAQGGALPVPPGISYNNEIDGDPGRMEWDGTRFLQIISFTVLFNRIVYGY